ncbi:MAG: energy transducer TonB [Prevotellaceae bacterium]|nr:energy transducer TonB [Candidatus Colivivens equi]
MFSSWTRAIEFEHLNQIPESTDEMANKGYIYALERKTAHEDVLNQFKAEAKRVVRTLAGKWTPGTQNGKPVNCKVRIPLAFRLETTVSQ